MPDRLGCDEDLLEAALSSLSGTGRLSMAEVSRRAGLSRATLYRRYRDRTALLDALTAHVLTGFERHMREAVDRSPSPGQRIPVVTQALSTYFEATPVMSELLVSDARFVLGFYGDSFAGLLDVLVELLKPAFRSGRGTGRRVRWVAEAILRNSMSYRLVGPDHGKLGPATFAEMVTAANREHVLP